MKNNKIIRSKLLPDLSTKFHLFDYSVSIPMHEK